tara:strand:+ start:345 stop:488 length:144 start_codon:yes stop_codon:yes gene_type:complete
MKKIISRLTKEKEAICIIAGVAVLLTPTNLIGWGLIAYGAYNIFMDR